jgi:hypothetical protein
MPPDPITQGPAVVDRPTDLAEQTLRQTRWNLALAVVLLLGYAALAGWAVWLYRHGARDEEDRLLAAVKQRLVQDAGPLTQEATDLAASVTPPVATALFEQVEEDLPTLTRTVQQQGREVADHLEATIEQKLEGLYRAERAKYQAALRQEFPEVTDPAVLGRVTDQFEDAFRKLIRRYHLKEYRDGVDRTAERWKAIPPAPVPTGGAKALAEQLDRDVTQWVRMNLLGDTAPPAGKEGRQ